MRYFKLLFIIFAFALFLNKAGFAQEVGPETELSFTVDSTDISALGFEGFASADIQVNLDLDNDGNKEFIFVNDYRGGNDTLIYVVLYENTGNDSYTPVWSYQFQEEGNNFPAVRVTDMDEDGFQEVCVGLPAVHLGPDYNPSRIFFFEVDSDGNLPTDGPTYSWNFDVADSADIRPSSLETGDFDNDGQNELAIAYRKTTNGEPALAIISIDNDLGSFVEVPKFELYDTTSNVLDGGTSTGTFDVHIADLDGDGNTEIITSHFSSAGLLVYEATGTDTYEKRVDFLVDFPGDFDNGTWDGLRDFNIDGGAASELFYAGRSGDIYIVTNDGDVSNIDSSAFHLFTNTNSPNRGIEVGDWDGDGNLDWFITGGNDQKLYRYEYKGSGDVFDAANWDSTMIYKHTELSRMWYVAMGNDMDGDGKKELFITFRKNPNQYPTIVVLEYKEPDAIGITEITPIKFALEQNYPNPFNPTTNIDFSLDKAHNISLTIYNSLGEKIKTLINNDQYSAGSHSVVWNGTNDKGEKVASGVYIYKIKVDYLSQVKRMMLLK